MLQSNIPTAFLLVKAIEEIVMGSSLTVFVSHAVKALPNSHHTQYLSVSCLTSYETVLLAAPYITLVHCNNLNSVTLPHCCTYIQLPPQLFNTDRSPSDLLR